MRISKSEKLFNELKDSKYKNYLKDNLIQKGHLYRMIPVLILLFSISGFLMLGFSFHSLAIKDLEVGRTLIVLGGLCIITSSFLLIFLDDSVILRVTRKKLELLDIYRITKAREKELEALEDKYA